MTIVRRWSLAILCSVCVQVTHADVFRPAYLQLTQRDATTYDVLWKAPALDESTSLGVAPEFPPGTRQLTPRRSSYANGMTVERYRAEVPGGLDGKAVSFSKLSRTRIDVLVRLVRTDGTVQLERILPADPRFEATVSPGASSVARTYTVLGVEHILSGFDHLLFVLALVIIVRGTKRLLITVTAFTLAHSITLALATLGVVRVPGPPVEAVIALSIVFVASEIVAQSRGREGLAARKPWAVAFTFGLLHGLGFAGALAQIGLPQNSIPLALLFFNVGVEIGQLVFIAAVLTASGLIVRPAFARIVPRVSAVFPAYLIGGIASYWVVERVVGFWG